MNSEDKYCDKYTLSSQLTNRSDPRSLPEYDSTRGGGDYTDESILLSARRYPESRVHGDRRVEYPTFSDDPAEWNKADYDYNINFLYDYMVNQRRYLKHDDEKYARNKEILANMKTIRKQQFDDSLWKKSESRRLKREVEGYEWQIRHQSSLGASSKIRFLAEDELNRDLKKQKRKLLREKEFLLRKQEEDGILEDVVDEYETAKQLLETEQDRRERLRQKAEWYDTEISTIHEVLRQQEIKEESDGDKLPDIAKETNCYVHPEANRSQNSAYLPDINKRKNNMVALKCTQERCTDILGRENYNQSSLNVHVPHPPSVERLPGHVTRSSAISNIHARVPHLVSCANINGHVPHPPSVSNKHESVLHLPKVETKNTVVSQPSSRKKDGSLKRFCRKIKNIIK